MGQQLDYRIDMETRSRWEIVSANGITKQNLIYMQEAGIFYSGPAYYTTRANLDSYLLKLTFSGKGNLCYKGESYDVIPGDFFWIDCKEHQDYRTASDSDHWYVAWVHFYGGHAANYYAMFQQLNQNCPVAHLADDRKARQIIERLLELRGDSSGEMWIDIQCASLLTQLLTILLESVCTPHIPKVPPVVSSIRDYLYENYSQSLTLDGLSAQFNISKFHLLRTFRQYLSMTPNEYLMTIRIAKAKELLRTTNLSVSMIANTVGMESTSYFISVFKKQEGVTPHKYRTVWSNDLV